MRSRCHDITRTQQQVSEHSKCSDNRHRDCISLDRIHRILQIFDRRTQVVIDQCQHRFLLQCDGIARGLLQQLAVGLSRFFGTIFAEQQARLQRQQAIARPQFSNRAIDLVQGGEHLARFFLADNLIQIVKNVVATTKLDLLFRMARALRVSVDGHIMFYFQNGTKFSTNLPDAQSFHYDPGQKYGN